MKKAIISYQPSKNKWTICSHLGCGLLLVILLRIVVLPTEPRWSRADIWLSWTVLSLFAFATVFSIAYLIQRRTEGKRIWNHLDLLIIIWSIYYILRIWLGGEYPCATTFLKTFEVILLYFGLRCILPLLRMPSDYLLIGLLVCAVYESVAGFTQLASGKSRHFLYFLTGTFLNPGPYAAFLVMGATIAVAWLQDLEKGWGKTIVTFVAVLPLILLPATWSRAAMLSLAIVVLLMFRKFYWRWRWALWTGATIVAVAFYFLKQGSADGRLLTWSGALTAWQHLPWFGVGIGGLQHAVATGISELYESYPSSPLFSTGGVAEYAFNDLLTILTEQGIAGAILIVSIVCCSMIKLWKCSKPLFYGLLSLLIFSLFSYPFELLPFRIITILIVAWAASSPTNEGKVEKTCWGTVFSLVLLTLAYLTTKEIAIRHVSDKEYSLFARMEHEAFIKDFYELLPLERDNARFLFDFGKTLRKQGRYNDSNDMLRRGTRVSADPMFYVIMGNNYMDMGEFDLAEQHYRKSFSTLPNRLYPLYQLMLLNKACDDADKTTFYARKVISFKEKVASPATQKMKEDARLYLQQQKDSYISE